MDIIIKNIADDELPSVAEIHINAFPDSLITKLGSECVTEYYRWQLLSPDKVFAIGAFMNDRLVGYCYGGVFSMALGGFIKRNKSLVFKQLLSKPMILLNPRFLTKTIRGMLLLLKFSVFKNRTRKTQRVALRSNFGILSIASDPATREKGIGRQLMSVLEKYAIEQNYNTMRLSVDPNNLKAITFYEHIGWVKICAHDKWNGQMEKELTIEK